MKRLTAKIMMLFLVLAGAAGIAAPAHACVGKTLVIGTTDSPQQMLLAEILALLISERTGTTVKIEQMSDYQTVHQAHLKADLDIVIGYTALGQLQVLRGEPIADAASLYQAVKGRYNEELNLVWLDPFGFQQPFAAAAEVPDQAAPVVRKDTLKKFPALARLINKLGGTIDNATMAALEQQASEKAPRDVARTFLRDNRLI